MPTIFIDIDSKGVVKGEGDISRALKAIEKNTERMAGSLSKIDKLLISSESKFRKTATAVGKTDTEIKKVNKSLDKSATQFNKTSISASKTRTATSMLQVALKQNAAALDKNQNFQRFLPPLQRQS